MADTDKVEWKLIGTSLTNSATDPILPASSSHLYFELCEPGSGELKIPLDSRAATGVSSGKLAVCNYRGSARGAFFVDNIQEAQAQTQENGGRYMSISGRGGMALLEDAIVWDDGTTATTRALTGSRAGVIKTLIDEAQARGGLAALTYDFTATTDSDGATWTDSDTYTLTVGNSVLDVMRQFVRTGTEFDIVYSAGGFVLSAYQGGIGSDKSETVYFRTGINCEEIKTDERGNDIANVLRVAYKAGNVTVTDSTSIAARRRREQLLNARVAQSLSSASTYGTAELSIKKDPQKSISLKIFDGVGPKAFVDYNVGDYVTLDVLGVETKYRILGLQCDFGGDDFSNITVELNSLLRSNNLQLEENVAWLNSQWETANDANQIETQLWAYVAKNCESTVNCMVLSGNLLYIGGLFASVGTIGLCGGIACYNIKTGTWIDIGLPWGAVYPGGGTGEVYCMDLDSNGNLYVGGYFESIGNVTANHFAMWDGNNWTAVGGVTNLNGEVFTVKVDGTNVYIGGYFTSVGGVANTASIARWDGASWNALGSGITNGEVRAIAVYGSNVYAGGGFGNIGGNAAMHHIAKWNGSAWSALSIGVDGTVYALDVDSSGNLYAGGIFIDAGGTVGIDKIAMWNGSAWSALGTGVNDYVLTINIDTFNNVWAGGGLTTAGGKTVNHLARWSGGNWLAVGKAGAIGTDGDVMAIAVTPSGDLYIGGEFDQAGDLVIYQSSCIAAYLTTFQAVMDYVNSGAGNAHPPVTIGTPENGLSITGGQVLTIAAASTGVTGALTNTDWNTFNGKLDSTAISDNAYDATTWDGDTTHTASKNAIRDKIESMGTSVVSDAAYDATTWDGDATHAPSKNAIRDKIETMGSAVDDTAYNATTWDGDTTHAPSKNAVRDKIESMGTGATTWFVTEDLTSQVTGATAHFTVIAPMIGIPLVYCNIRQLPGDVTVDDDGLGFTLSFTPTTSDKLIVDYHALTTHVMYDDAGVIMTDENGYILEA